MRFRAQYTDTMGGEANYSWLREVDFELPADCSDLTLVRKAKAELGLTGCKCDRETWGETIVLRPRGECTVVFIDHIEGE